MNRVVLITGASTGFGRYASEEFARRGDRVFATMRETCGRNVDHAEALRQLANREKLSLDVLDLDVADEASVSAAVGQALERAGRLDVVINNAGIAALGVTEAFTPEQFKYLFDVNVLGAIRVNRAVLPAMRRQRSGLLIHVSSGAGRCTVPAMAPYCASKYAVESLADAYRYELRPFGVDSVLVEPGIYKTEIFDRYASPADRERLADYGPQAEYAGRVLGVFQTAIGAPDAPGPRQVVDAFVRLADMEFGARPFRTVVSAPIEQLLKDYNAIADGLRPIVAQIFNVPDLADAPGAAVAAS
jgi:NAD(P)-dependent dehydrogenase (short-subunit alcohol dehydrogenase family)